MKKVCCELVAGLQYVYTVAWSRSDGRLPAHAIDDGQGSLHIHNVQPSDEGTYVCTGSNSFSFTTDEALLEIGCQSLFVFDVMLDCTLMTAGALTLNNDGL